MNKNPAGKKATPALTLYVKSGCAYAAMVLLKLAELGLDFKEKNIVDPGVVEELIARSGDRHTPYLVDDRSGEEVRESGNIVAYLEKHYGEETHTYN